MINDVFELRKVDLNSPPFIYDNNADLNNIKQIEHIGIYDINAFTYKTGAKHNYPFTGKLYEDLLANGFKATKTMSSEQLADKYYFLNEKTTTYTGFLFVFSTGEFVVQSFIRFPDNLYFIRHYKDGKWSKWNIILTDALAEYELATKGEAKIPTYDEITNYVFNNIKGLKSVSDKEVVNNIVAKRDVLFRTRDIKLRNYADKENPIISNLVIKDTNYTSLDMVKLNIGSAVFINSNKYISYLNANDTILNETLTKPTILIGDPSITIITLSGLNSRPIMSNGTVEKVLEARKDIIHTKTNIVKKNDDYIIDIALPAYIKFVPKNLTHIEKKVSINTTNGRQVFTAYKGAIYDDNSIYDLNIRVKDPLDGDHIFYIDKPFTVPRESIEAYDDYRRFYFNTVDMSKVPPFTDMVVRGSKGHVYLELKDNKLYVRIREHLNETDRTNVENWIKSVDIYGIKLIGGR